MAGGAFAGMKVTVMGLGLHGGGLESARWLASKGAAVTVTDLRDAVILAPSLEKLDRTGFSFRYVLGRHEDADFRLADLVIKNPGVHPGSPWLALARRVETDISLFLAVSPARLLAVTGSKGKSSTASALYHVLHAQSHAAGGPSVRNRAFLGGNITVSPLSFLDGLGDDDDVILELSSWQLGDLRGRRNTAGGPLLKPRAAAVTAILPDHLDRYGSMENYVADKRIICQGQDGDDITVAFDDPWGRLFLAESRGRTLANAAEPLPPERAGGWLDGNGAGLARLRPGVPPVPVLPPELSVPGKVQKRNLLSAALVLTALGLPAETAAAELASFPGIEHRLEFFHEKNGVKFYNDSAATIPEAASAALESFPGKMALLSGGTDKDLDFSPLARSIARAWTAGRLAPPVLLEGTGSDKLKVLLDGAGVPAKGPFGDLDAAVHALLEEAAPGTAAILSPGCASFGMFLNEFDRGRRWKDAVRRLA